MVLQQTKEPQNEDDIWAVPLVVLIVRFHCTTAVELLKQNELIMQQYNLLPFVLNWGSGETKREIKGTKHLDIFTFKPTYMCNPSWRLKLSNPSPLLTGGRGSLAVLDSYRSLAMVSLVQTLMGHMGVPACGVY